MLRQIATAACLSIALLLLGPASGATEKSSSSAAPASDQAVKAHGYISVDQVRPGDKFKVAVVLNVADGYHINAHVPSEDYLVATEVKFKPPTGITIGSPAYPAPINKSFEFSPGKDLSVYEGNVIIAADASAGASLAAGSYAVGVQVEVQSCSTKQCLAPTELDFEIPIERASAGAGVSPANAAIFSKAPPTTGTGIPEPASASGSHPEPVLGVAPPAGAQPDQSSSQNRIAGLISRNGLPLTLAIVFLFGIALNGTPCVYPLIGITIGFFANQSKESSKLKGTFTMSAFFVLGIAIVYSALGVVASRAGGLFGAALQNRFVLIGVAAIMVTLALSMFGLYEFKLPDSLTRFATSSTQNTSGALGSLMMGLTMGIVAAPCIGPFVSALIAYVAKKGDPIYGFTLFFVLSIGLGTPYLFLGAFSGAMAKLPRSGMWMVTVRKVLGLVVLGLAIYFLNPILGGFFIPVLIGYLSAAAVYLILWEASRTRPRQFSWVLRAIGAFAVMFAVFLAIPRHTDARITWQPYSEAALVSAGKSGKAVIVDAYASWCLPCKELDNATFTNASVSEESGQFVMLKLDLTRVDSGGEQDRAVRRYGIRGVPTVLFINPSGAEQPNLRLEEFEKPAAFLDRMKKFETAPESRGAQAAPPPNLAAASGAPSASDHSLSSERVPSAAVDLLDGGKLDLSSLKGRVVHNGIAAESDFDRELNQLLAD